MEYIVMYDDHEYKMAHLVTKEEAERSKKEIPPGSKWDTVPPTEFFPLDKNGVERVISEGIRFYNTYYEMAKDDISRTQYKPEPEKQAIINELNSKVENK